MRHEHSVPIQMLRKAHDVRKTQTQEERDQIAAWLAQNQPTPCPKAFVAETLQADPTVGKAAYVTVQAPMARDPKAARKRAAEATNELARRRAKDRLFKLVAAFQRTGNIGLAAEESGYSYKTAYEHLRDAGLIASKAEKGKSTVETVTQMLAAGKSSAEIAEALGITPKSARAWVRKINQYSRMAAE
jgi:hypothetical protein